VDFLLHKATTNVADNNDIAKLPAPIHPVKKYIFKLPESFTNGFKENIPFFSQ
jgi:hypothetical protein